MNSINPHAPLDALDACELLYLSEHGDEDETTYTVHLDTVTTEATQRVIKPGCTWDKVKEYADSHIYEVIKILQESK